MMLLRSIGYGVLFLLCACKNDLDQLASIDINADSPDRVTLKAEYFYSDSGVVRNRLRAGQVAEYLSEGTERTEMSEGVELVFFDVHGRTSSVLSANKGLIRPKANRMEVFEKVVFTNSRGERMETEHLVWEQDSARVFTEDPLRILRANDTINGLGLDANEDFSRYTIRRITGTVHATDIDSTETTK